MTDGATWSLVVMAIALAVMTMVQVGVAIAAFRATRRMTTAVDELRRDVAPLLEKAHRVAEDAVRISALAVVQGERVDALMATTARRLEETVSAVQSFVAGPLRHGAAVIAGLKAALVVARQWQESAPPPAREPEEDAMFVG